MAHGPTLACRLSQPTGGSALTVCVAAIAARHFPANEQRESVNSGRVPYLWLKIHTDVGPGETGDAGQ